MSVERIVETIDRQEFVKRLKARQTMKRLPIHQFDEVGDTNGKINKSFGLIEGHYIEQMYYDLLADPDNNFVTCVDECLYDQKIELEEFKKMKISSILKVSKSTQYEKRHNSSEAERSTKAELICSRVANLYNIKTEYVAPIRNNPYGCIVVDFLSGDQQLEDFGEFTGKHPTVYNGNSSIRKWMDPFLDEILKRAPVKDYKAKCAYVRPMMKEMVKQYIFKKYIVHDADFCSANLGIVSTPDNKYMTVSPIYDFERCLLPGIRSGQGVGLEEDLRFLVKHWPGLLKSILKDFTLSSVDKQKMKSMIKQFEPSADKAREYFNIIENSTFNFLGLSQVEFAHQGVDFESIPEDKEFI